MWRTSLKQARLCALAITIVSIAHVGAEGDDKLGGTFHGFPPGCAKCVINLTNPCNSESIANQPLNQFARVDVDKEASRVEVNVSARYAATVSGNQGNTYDIGGSARAEYDTLALDFYEMPMGWQERSPELYRAPRHLCGR